MRGAARIRIVECVSATVRPSGLRLLRSQRPAACSRASSATIQLASLSLLVFGESKCDMTWVSTLFLRTQIDCKRRLLGLDGGGPLYTLYKQGGLLDWGVEFQACYPLECTAGEHGAGYLLWVSKARPSTQLRGGRRRHRVPY